MENTAPATLAPILALAAALLAYAETLDVVVDVRAATTYDPRYRVPNAVAALELLVYEVGDAANPTTARCIVHAAQKRLDAVGERVGILRAA